MKKLFVFCSIMGLAVLMARPAAAQAWRPQADTPGMAGDASRFVLLDNSAVMPDGLGWRLVAPTAPIPTTTTVNLWPNPAHGTVQIEAEATPAPVQLYDALGRLSRTTTFVPGTTHLDLHGLPPGVYTVRLDTATARLVVE